jgi:2-methylcitrate dehydratase PrpD
MASTTFAAGSAPVWFTGIKLSPAGAAWCNAMAASALDFDDGHRLARGHPGSAIVPAVLAQAAQGQNSTAEVLSAIAIGYEVAVATAAAQKFEKSRTYQSGRWVGFGVAAACGRLARLDAGQLANALAIAGVWAPNQQANGSSGYAQQTGNWAKEGIATATLQAMMAVELALEGFTGPLDLLDYPEHYHFAPPIDQTMSPALILGNYFKAYACCRYIHPALDAFLSLTETVTINAQDIARIEVATFSWALRLGNAPRPATLVEAQYSLPFCLATLLVHGREALSPMPDEILGDDQVRSLAGRIYLRVSPEIDALFPLQTLAQMRVVLVSGRVLENHRPIGPVALTRRDLLSKLSSQAAGRLPKSRYKQIVRAVDPHRGDFDRVQRLVSEPVLIEHGCGEP